MSISKIKNQVWLVESFLETALKVSKGTFRQRLARLIQFLLCITFLAIQVASAFMAKYQILFWHDIPMQVRAGGRRDRVSAELPQRFQLAVDNAAMAANLTGTDAYLEGFRWGDSQEREGTPEEVANAVAAELDAQFTKIDWRNTAVNITNPQADE